jgi:hypothetical protein
MIARGEHSAAWRSVLMMPGKRCPAGAVLCGAGEPSRGSMPGERRGGRKRTTPNRTTILADRIVAVLDKGEVLYKWINSTSSAQRLSCLIVSAKARRKFEAT